MKKETENIKSQLIRAKLLIETEIVIENYYGDDPQKCAESACRRNMNDIISQAYESNQVKVTDVLVIKNKKQLPPYWQVDCLPWLPSIAFGNSKQEQKISEFFKE